MTSYIFKSKAKNITATVFTAIYLMSRLYDAVTDAFQNQRMSFLSLMSFAPYILVLIYLLALEKEYKIKEFMFPVAFLCSAALSVYTIAIVLRDSLYSADAVIYALKLLTFDIIMLAAFVLCVIGSADNFKTVVCFKIGTLALAITAFILPIASFIAVGGFEYIASVPEGYPAISYTVLLECVLSVLYYFGLFNLTLNKKQTSQE